MTYELLEKSIHKINDAVRERDQYLEMLKRVRHVIGLLVLHDDFENTLAALRDLDHEIEQLLLTQVLGTKQKDKHENRI